MNPLEEYVKNMKNLLHAENTCKKGMIHLDFYCKQEITASFAKTYFLDIFAFNSQNWNLSKHSVEIGYAPAKITPCRTRILSHIAGVYISNLLNKEDFEARRVYLSGVFCLGPGKDSRVYVHKFNLDNILEDDLDKLYIPGKKRFLEKVTASDFESF